MTFDANVTRLNSGVTLDIVHTRLVAKIQAEGIVEPSQVYPVLDDEIVPESYPSHDRFITVRLPSLIWAHGDVMTGGGNLCEFIMQGQTRITLWLRNEADILGRVTQLAGEALAAPPRGTRLLGRLMRLLWEDDVLDEDGNAILKRPLMFVSYEPPEGSQKGWRPFRSTWQLEFAYDVSVEV